LGFGFRVQGSGFRVQGLHLAVLLADNVALELLRRGELVACRFRREGKKV